MASPEPKSFDYVIEEPALIRGGYVEISVAGLKIRQRVKRSKGVGAVFNGDIPDKIHIEIMRFLVDNVPAQYDWTVKQTHYSLNQKRIHAGLKPHGFSTVQGRLSELQGKKIIILTKKPKWYRYDPARLLRVLHDNSFK